MADETENDAADDSPETQGEGREPEPETESGPGGVAFDELSGSRQGSGNSGKDDDDQEQRSANDLEPVFDVPVKVQAVLGRSNLEVSQLLKLAPGAVLELDRKIGEAIDIYVNNRLVARGEVVLVEDHLGVTMTEIVKTEQN